MNNHQSFKANLSVEQRRSLTELDDTPGLIRLATHSGAIFILALLITLKVALWPFLMLPLGILLVFLFTLLHETAHNTAFKTPQLNLGIGMLCGLVLFLPPLWFQYFHWAHHRYTQLPGKDPELASPKPSTATQYMRHITGIPIWINHITTLVTLAAGTRSDDYLPTGKRKSAQRQALAMCIFYVVIVLISFATGSAILLFIWLIPLLLGQPFLRVYLLAEHGACPQIEDMFQNTRTTFTNWIVRLFAWNMPYHTEHHVYPNVPFHRLPQLHSLMESHLKTSENGYIRFNRKYFKAQRS